MLNRYLVFRFVQQKLGGRSISDYEKLQAEKSDLQMKYDELEEAHRETCRQVSVSINDVFSSSTSQHFLIVIAEILV